jgi:ubiquinone/menaquinone biosynthesis C-methylase UbiE
VTTAGREAAFHRRVQRYGWDLAVEPYERYWLPVLRFCSERVLELAAVQQGESVLDIATGTGVAAFLAADIVGPEGRVVATDISEGMVARAAAHARERGLEQMTFQRLDAEQLTLPDNSFDVGLCVLGLMYPADPQQAINEMYRVLKPGGRAVACVWGRRDRCGWREVFPIVDAHVESHVCPLFFALGAEGALRYSFQAAGFAHLQEERLERVLNWPTADEALGAIFPGGPVALAYSRFSEDVRRTVEDEYLASIEAHRTAAGFEVPGELVFVRGAKN